MTFILPVKFKMSNIKYNYEDGTMRLNRKRIMVAIAENESSMGKVSVKAGMKPYWLSPFLRNNAGKRKPYTFRMIEKLSQVLGVSESELVELDEGKD